MQTQISPLTVKKLSRQQQAQFRKDAILQAAFVQFTQNGFALTRVEDIAKEANVGKGTIYTYFDSKEMLLEQLVKQKMLPIIPKEKDFPEKLVCVKDFCFEVILRVMNKLLDGEAGMLLNLILTEGERFPQITKMYYDLIISKAMLRIQKILEIAVKNGELKNKDLVAFPQLIVAPIIQSIVWKRSFSAYHPLNFEQMLKVYFDSLFMEIPVQNQGGSKNA